MPENEQEKIIGDTLAEISKTNEDYETAKSMLKGLFRKVKIHLLKDGF